MRINRRFCFWRITGTRSSDRSVCPAGCIELPSVVQRRLYEFISATTAGVLIAGSLAALMISMPGDPSGSPEQSSAKTVVTIPADDEAGMVTAQFGGGLGMGGGNGGDGGGAAAGPGLKTGAGAATQVAGPRKMLIPQVVLVEPSSALAKRINGLLDEETEITLDTSLNGLAGELQNQAGIPVIIDHREVEKLLQLLRQNSFGPKLKLEQVEVPATQGMSGMGGGGFF